MLDAIEESIGRRMGDDANRDSCESVENAEFESSEVHITHPFLFLGIPFLRTHTIKTMPNQPIVTLISILNPVKKQVPFNI